MEPLTDEQKKELIAKDGDLKIKPKVGRPPKYTNKEELQAKIDAYFEECALEPSIPTIAGLAYAIGLDRQTVYNYAEKDEFIDTIKTARDYVLNRIEKKLVNSTGNVGGSIFIAKNYGYKDEKTLQAKISIEDILEEG
jgi:DNA-binding XRE family transcriptional regulator